MVIIEKGTTAIRIICNSSGYLAEAPQVSIWEFLRKNLTEYEWDNRKKVSIFKYAYYRYDKVTGVLNLPINILRYLETYFRTMGVVFTINQIAPNPSVDINIINSGIFEDRDYQVDAVKFLINPKQYMKALELQTGRGKTYIAIRTIMEIRKRAIIIVPAFLMVQWNDSLTAMCDAKLGVIQGSKSIQDIVNANYETDVDVFLASITTLQEYAMGGSIYNVMPPFSEFILNLQIGVKVVDECHLNFSANMMIDIQSDVEHNIYLSATYIRSSKNSHAIFRKIFPDEIKYDSGVADRYVDVTEVQYSLGPIEKKRYSVDRGYSQFKYEKFILRSPQKLRDFINKVLYPVVEKYYIEKKRDGQKLLILVGLREFAELLGQWFDNMYPNLKSVAFLGGSEESELVESDIIISTAGSAGTGKDIKNLRTMLLFTSFSSEATTMQTMGRLRKLEEDTPEFCYLINVGVDSHLRHSEVRRPIYKHLGKSFTVVSVSEGDRNHG